jgi:hypothetical protein
MMPPSAPYGGHAQPSGEYVSPLYNSTAIDRVVHPHPSPAGRAG